ncbi:hypothetical protein [Allocoleopsis franciscana]|uniref:Uncharacterized protein n=1 Tax=Allocoleopsis franciscana PCC 7113 TaxID=1173027 RepID=K9WQC9_9CYAN|nr:hypothetical protein [Allocoleopsis franciscana]AFZ22388.1 hypothetical protein Mic7113_6831 [Allocoleopsis franciscana PCC 7113]
MHKSISKHPLITALAADYAREIKALKEEHESQIEAFYKEFSRKYQCLKRIIEVLDDSADSMDNSSAINQDLIS